MEKLFSWENRKTLAETEQNLDEGLFLNLFWCYRSGRKSDHKQHHISPG